MFMSGNDGAKSPLCRPLHPPPTHPHHPLRPPPTDTTPQSPCPRRCCLRSCGAPNDGDCICEASFTTTPSLSPSTSASSSVSPSITSSESSSPSLTPSFTVSFSVSPSKSQTRSISLSISASSTTSPSRSPCAGTWSCTGPLYAEVCTCITLTPSQTAPTQTSSVTVSPSVVSLRFY